MDVFVMAGVYVTDAFFLQSLEAFKEKIWTNRDNVLCIPLVHLFNM